MLHLFHNKEDNNKQVKQEKTTVLPLLPLLKKLGISLLPKFLNKEANTLKHVKEVLRATRKEAPRNKDKETKEVTLGKIKATKTQPKIKDKVTKTKVTSKITDTKTTSHLLPLLP
jgi:hypothetical protein